MIEAFPIEVTPPSSYTLSKMDRIYRFTRAAATIAHLDHEEPVAPYVLTRMDMELNVKVSQLNIRTGDDEVDSFDKDDSFFKYSGTIQKGIASYIVLGDMAYAPEDWYMPLVRRKGIQLAEDDCVYLIVPITEGNDGRGMLMVPTDHSFGERYGWDMDERHLEKLASAL